MSSYSLKPITETSWILQQDGNRIALITKNNNKLHALGKLDQVLFDDFKALENYLGSKLEVEKHEDEEVSELGIISGFPAKHAGAQAIEGSELPVYRRSSTSNTFYAAGYYGVRFPNGWVQSYCPKLATLKENEFIGPFTTKLEMQNAISQKKRTFNL